MKITLRGVSGAALLFGLAGIQPALAQQSGNQTIATTQPQVARNLGGPQVAQADQAADQAKPEVDQTRKPASEAKADKVIVTGSLIATLPEDAPKPVEVFTSTDLKEQGSPTVTEFVRSLTASYGDDLGFGQASPDVPQGTGFGNANLRGVGSNGTLVLMNGKNLAPWNGAYGADINGIPMEALEAVEVLKDGASATYGAGAVGGVINFRTRRDINAPQVSVEKQFYDGSDGYYKIDFLTGWKGDAGNLLLSLSHSHEDEMLMTARRFSSLPFAIDPAQWTLTGSNPGQFQPSISNFYTNTGGIIASFPGIQDYRTASDCTAVGGQIANVLQKNGINTLPTVPNTSCAFSQSPFQSLVNQNDTTRAYVEFNGNISDTMEFHFDVTYNTSDTYEARIPVDPALATAIDRQTDSAARRGFFLNSCFSCNYVVPVQVQTYSTAGAGLGAFVRNPFVDDFMARTGTSALALPNTGALYMGGQWRPYLWGGDPLNGDGRRRDQFERDGLIVNAGIKGEFGGDSVFGKLLNGVSYSFDGQYNQYLNTYHQPDIFASRLQNAMLGYGGPNCNAVDRVATDYTSAASYNRTVGIQSDTAAGTRGCQWFNPFASAFATSVVNHAANPQFNSGAPVLGVGATARPSGYANSKEMMDWMIGDRIAEYQLQSGTFNGQLSGQIPKKWFELPGGQIGWAVGTQWRQVEGRSTQRDNNRDEQDMAEQPCVFPDRAVVATPPQVEPGLGTPGCTFNGGAFYGTGRVNIVVTIPPFYYDTQTIAAFAEVQLPVLHNLNFTLSGRHEEYNGGDLIGDIYSVAGKYDVTDNLYLRASYGTNYRADNALQLQPGTQTLTTTTQSRFGSGFQTTQSTIVQSGIGPEEDATLNAGIGWKSDLFGGRFRASADFWRIKITGQVSTTSATTILNDVFGLNTSAAQGNRGVAGIPNTAITNSSGQFANCGAGLISFVSFATPCVTGVTTAADLIAINRYQVNGPGFTTDGIDYALDYSHPLFDGALSIQLVATQNLTYKATGYDVNGVVFDTGGDRLGRANYTSTGNESRRWRANGVLRWANDIHNVSLRANYSSGVYNEAFPLGLIGPPIVVDDRTTPGVNETQYSTYGYLPKEFLDFDLNYIYSPTWMKGLELRASVLNIFDKDPSPAQGRSGYYNGTGDPRGRIVQIGATKKF